MVRIALRAVGLVLSLVSMGAMLTSRGAEGEPSVLERIPALMAALDAKARELEAIRAAGSAEGAARAAGRPGAPLGDAATGASVPGTRQVVVAPATEGEPPRALGGVPIHAGMPSGTAKVRVHRGLP